MFSSKCALLDKTHSTPQQQSAEHIQLDSSEPNADVTNELAQPPTGNGVRSRARHMRALRRLDLLILAVGPTLLTVGEIIHVHYSNSPALRSYVTNLSLQLGSRSDPQCSPILPVYIPR